MNYNKNYLTAVACRLDFASRPAGLSPTEKTEFTSQIAEKYPVVNEMAKVNFSVQIAAVATGAGVEQSVVGRSWHHRKVKDGKLVAVLDPEFFSLESLEGGFTTFDDFKG